MAGIRRLIRRREVSIVSGFGLLDPLVLLTLRQKQLCSTTTDTGLRSERLVFTIAFVVIGTRTSHPHDL